MPAPELTRTAVPAAASETQVCGWGGGPLAAVRLWRAPDARTLQDRLGGPAEPSIARGMGRSYGDAAQLTGGLVLDTTGLGRYELDESTGILTTEAGVTLGALLRDLVPRGWILPVLPGTQHVTIGGMLACDVHGKNHGVAGSIARHVEALGLLTAAGELIELLPGDARFQATIGGMGLTGVIVSARIALRRIRGPLMSVDTDRAGDLDEVLALLGEPGGEHRVAWLDLLGGRGALRGVVTRASYADTAAHGEHRGVDARATVPRWWPGTIPAAGVKAFNELRFRTSPQCRRDYPEPIGPHMFPLDRLAAWPRLYGPAGLVQYQLVVPFDQAPVLERVIATLRAHRVPCFLAVLKDFGEAAAGPLSFPMPGWTLALDMPRAAPGLEPALSNCDELVAEAGGRVYLAKDSRLRPELLQAMYPRLEEWREQRAELDPESRWRSDLSTRLHLAEPSGAANISPTSVGRRVLLIGGTSEIGLAIVNRLADHGPVTPYLLGRHPEQMKATVARLNRAGASAYLDANDMSTHEPAVDAAFRTLGEVDVVVLAIGLLGGQDGLTTAPETAAEILQLNLAGCGGLLMAALRRLERQRRGSLVVLSSVAAERPRAGNPVYGAAKAGLDALAQGLSDAVAGSGVEVIVVRPGFVRTKMTVGLEAAPLATTPEAVAEAAVSALGRGSRTVWVPATLRPLSSALRHLPRPLYRRLPL